MVGTHTGHGLPKREAKERVTSRSIAFKESFSTKPELFHRKPEDRSGCDKILPDISLAVIGRQKNPSPHLCSTGGATLKTSASVVTPAATFIAPEIRSGFMPSRKARSRIRAMSRLSLIACLMSGDRVRIS